MTELSSLFLKQPTTTSCDRIIVEQTGSYEGTCWKHTSLHWGPRGFTFQQHAKWRWRWRSYRQSWRGRPGQKLLCPSVSFHVVFQHPWHSVPVSRSRKNARYFIVQHPWSCSATSKSRTTYRGPKRNPGAHATVGFSKPTSGPRLLIAPKWHTHQISSNNDSLAEPGSIFHR